MIKRRMYSDCGLYFLSLKAKSLHGASCRVSEGRIENTTERVRPLRGADCRDCCVCDDISRDGVGHDG